MELFQVFWDDQKKLFLEFEKNDEEQVQFLPEKINRLNIQYEISKIVKQEIYYKQFPSLVSIKKIYHCNEYLGFSIELDEIHGYPDIQIKILKLTFYLYSGERIEYTFSEKFNVSDIWINDDCYAGFQFVDLSLPKNQKKRITRERVVQATKTDFNQKKEEKTGNVKETEETKDEDVEEKKEEKAEEVKEEAVEETEEKIEDKEKEETKKEEEKTEESGKQEK